MPDTNPFPTETPLAGTTTIDANLVFEPERLTYVSAREVARRLCDEIDKECKDIDREKPIVVASIRFLADLGNLESTRVLLDALRQDYRTLVQRADQSDRRKDRGGPQANVLNLVSSIPSAGVLGAGVPGAGSLVPGLSGALGVASLFREDVSFSGVKTAVDGLSFEIAVARELKSGSFKEVLIPEFYVIHDREFSEGSLRGHLQGAEQERLRVWQQVTPMVSKLVALDAELEQKAREQNQGEVDRLTQEINSLRSDLNPISEPLAKVDQRFTDLIAELQKTDAFSGLSGLARLLRAEAVQVVKPNYLHAKVVVSGGHNRVSRSLLRTLFLGDGISFMGGCVVRWALLNEEGVFIKGGVRTARKAGRFPPLPFCWRI